MVAKAVLTFFIFILFAPLLIAQQDSLHPVCKLLKLNSKWDFGAGARFSFLDFDELNRSLEAAGLPGLESPLSCLDVGIRTTHSWERIVAETGFKYSFGSSEKENLGNRQSVTFRDYALQSRFLFDVFGCKNHMRKIFPYMGLGVSYQTLNTYSSTSSDFGNSSASLALGYQRYTYVPFSFETGVSLEQGFKMFGKNIFLGFRSGYAFRFFQTKWSSLEDNYAVNLPKPAASAPFVALIVRVKSRPKMVCQVPCGN
ncbi:MAG TPA: hypothetical protein PK228_07340 [Saprospiraceae bacterium]|nr:hypothetical protein [Saprospiraceae bacterium]